MPEHRGRKHHQDRVAETLRLEIGAMIEGELSDPRIAFCYVSEVVLNQAVNRHGSTWLSTTPSPTSPRPRRRPSPALKPPRDTSATN